MPDESGVTDPYDLVLSDLYAKRDQINHAIAAIEAMRGQGSGAAGISSASVSGAQRQEPPKGHDLLGLSIVDAAKKLLAAKRKPLRNPDIATLFKEGGLVLNSREPANTIGSVLTRRFMDVGDVVRVDRGTWGLKEWYPNRSFKKASEGADKGEAPESPAAEPERGGGIRRRVVTVPPAREHWKTRQKREREEAAAKAASGGTNGT
jgi:hypothetical protein